jgi:cytochrome P450
LVALKRNPLECWSREHFEQPVVRHALPFRQALVVNDPAAIRHVLLENAANYRKDKIQRRVLSAGFGDGLLTAEGDEWRAQRRTVAPLFARKTVMQFTPAMLAAAGAMADRWRAADGETIDVAAEMGRVALDILVRTIFSDGIGCDMDEFRQSVAAYFSAIGKIGPLDLIGLPGSLPRMAQLKSRSTLRFFDATIDEIIATRRQRLAEQPDDVPLDMLSLLLAALDPDTGERLSVAEVRSNILTFISAGHETVANALSWALFLLSQSPEWRARLAAEAEREFAGPVEGLSGRLTETRAVFDEAVRLYPPIAVISRMALGPDQVAGETVKRGALILVAPYVLHRHRLLWRDPDDFDPTRFLNGGRAAVDRFAYLPFGVGPRICIGSAFALQEAAIVLATVMHNFDLEPVPGHTVWPLLRVTLRPAGGLPMIVRSRRSNGR